MEAHINQKINQPASFRLIATDIDGTLANSAGELTPYTIRVLRALSARGLTVALVTGLNPWPARRYLEQLGADIRAISLNGIFLLEDGKVHESEFLAQELVRQVAEMAVEAGYVPQVYGADLVVRYLPAPAGNALMQRLVAERPFQPYVAVESLDALLAVRPAQIAFHETEPRARRLYERLLAEVGDHAYVVFQPGARSWVEVNHAEARKDVALLALARRLDVAPEEIIYFGDNLNDLSVFKAVPHCVAMGNARPEIQALAWQETGTNDEDGVARLLSRLFALEG
ncbi:MAG TPA: HAD hydrolase family protein [Thermoflexia bacterium]|nr:HAD hydrolase family protein [Thermoflexia bacterium]